MGIMLHQSEIVGINLRKLRGDVSLYRLAKDMDVNIYTLRNIEQGRYFPSLYTLTQYANQFGIEAVGKGYRVEGLTMKKKADGLISQAELGSRLKGLRVSKKYSAARMANLLGISRTALYNIEKGIFGISLYTLNGYIDIFGIDKIERVFGWR